MCSESPYLVANVLGKTKNQALSIETVIPKEIGSDTPYYLSNPPLNTPSSYLGSAACYRVRRSQKHVNFVKETDISAYIVV